MKTAIIKTDFWKDDDIYELSIDERMLYLCILTNPERNTTPAFKCSDRIMSAFTGFNTQQMQVARQRLIDREKIIFIEGYYLIRNQDFVDTKRGKLSSDKYLEDLKTLPKGIQDIILKNKDFRSRAALEPLESIEIEKEIDTEIVVEKEKDTEKSKQISEVIKALEKVDAKNKLYYGNKTQRKACEFIIQEYGFQEVLDMIAVIPSARLKIPYFPSVTTPCELRDKWVKIYEAVHRNNKNNKDIEFV